MRNNIYPYRSLRPSTPPCPLPTPPCLSCWWIEDSTGSWELSPGTTLPTFSAWFSSPSWRSSTELTMAVSRWWRRFCSNQRTGYPNLELLIPAPLDLLDTPPPLTLYPRLTPRSTQPPSWPDEPTSSLATLELHPPFHQGNDIVVTLHQLNKVGEGLADEVLLEWTLDMLCSLEDWRWLWSPEQATTPLSSPILLNHQTSLSYNVSNANLWTTYILNAPSTFVPSVDGLPLDTPNALAPCAHAQSVESSVIWAPVAQPQPQLTHPLSLPVWATWEDLELMPQGYEGGNVTVEEAPTSFSPFSLVNCMLLSHFSFNDFVAVAFLDLARDLDTQI